MQTLLKKIALVALLGLGLAACGHKAPPTPPEDTPQKSRLSAPIPAYSGTVRV